MKKFNIRKKNVLKTKNKKSSLKKSLRNRAFRKRKTKENSLASKKARIKKTIIKKRHKRLFTDENFSLLNDTQNVIDYIAELKRHRFLNKHIGSITIDLSLVKRIDIGSISLLLSSIKELNIYGINIEGNLPNAPDCRDLILSSGYIENMSSVSNSLKTTLETFTSKNMIIMSGGEISAGKKIGQCLQQAIMELYGQPLHYPPIYGMIQEINGNSVEHAYKKHPHWIFGVNHDKVNQKIIFTFTDNGFGILQTLKRRIKKAVLDTLNLKTDEDILIGLFEKEYNSRFKKQYNRNKGLPVVRKTQVNKKLNNLMVVTNNVLLHLDSYESLKLNSSFSGTFYYWELDIETFKYGKGIS